MTYGESFCIYIRLTLVVICEIDIIFGCVGIFEAHDVFAYSTEFYEYIYCWLIWKRSCSNWFRLFVNKCDRYFVDGNIVSV